MATSSSDGPAPSGDAAAAPAAVEVGAIARGKLWQFRRILAPDGRTVALLLGLALALWLATGIYKVQPDENGVVQHFGKWTVTTGPGLHYHLPYPIETVTLPKVTKINQISIGRSFGDPSSGSRTTNQMLTGDENIVEADCAVFWRIKDPEQYLFKVADPDEALRVTTEAAIREVIGRNPIQSAMSDKRQQIAEEIRTVLQHLADSYELGIEITQVQLQRVDPPPAVIDAFNDVQRARSDQERARNEADAYRNDILPRARGQAEKITQDAEAYKSQVVDLAEGEAKSLQAIYEAYKAAPDVVGWRLYLEAVDELLKRASKVIVDSSGKGLSSILPVLPIDPSKPLAAVALPRSADPAQPQPGAPK
ncbi:MAG: FtsH protease activity modulator HflK [Ancalomicrobiaceae bacterium]|nr:FtsH protease activity modulator HflK [Ancalomicrobiaceae bacterium]